MGSGKKKKKDETGDEIRLDGPAVSSSSSGEVPPAGEPGTADIFLDRGPGLPESYGEDRITALVRDPANLFFFWELDGPRSREQRETLGADRFTNRRWILRLANLTLEESQDVAIYPYGGDWYLTVEPGCEYSAEIGVLHDDGGFELFARSNRVRTPRHGLSADVAFETEAGGGGVPGAPEGAADLGLGEAPSSWLWASSSGMFRRKGGKE